MFSRYFKRELRFLREVGRLFAGAHSNTAGMLGQRRNDPDVERLLEGLAFLSAQAHERFDREASEAVHDLATLLLPHYMRTIPALSVVEFSPNPSAMSGRVPVDASCELATVAIDHTACHFRPRPAYLVPLSIEDASLEDPRSASPLLRLVFRSTKSAVESVFDEVGIRLFLHGEFAVTTTLWLWLVRHCRDVTVRPLDASGRAVTLGPEVIQPVGFDPLDPEEALLPWPRFAPPGFALLQEYFTLPQKFLFLDLRPLSAARAAAAERFEITFRFDRPPELPGAFSPGTFRLNCVPVINLFRASAEPILSELPGAEHVLRPAQVDPAHAEVYSVVSVRGSRRGEAERRSYPNFFDFKHVADPRNPGAAATAFFHLRRELSASGDGLDAYLSVSTPRDVVPDLAEEVLSIDLVCTNRSLAGRVRSGDICVPTPTSPAETPFKNLLPATAPVLPPLGNQLLWRLISHFAITRHSIQSAKALRVLLSLYDFQGTGRNRIEAIQSLESRPERRSFDGASLWGVCIVIELAEASFASRGEAFLFGSIINELFASRVAMGSFTELTIRLQPSRAEYGWPPRNGRQVLI
jgi:type VI secretion system protein ImpG